VTPSDVDLQPPPPVANLQPNTNDEFFGVSAERTDKKGPTTVDIGPD